MSKADKLSQVTEVVAKNLDTLYDGNHERQRAIFEAITAQKAAERRENPEQTVAFLTSLLNLGASLNEEERANAHSNNKTVEIKAIERSIEKNLAASGKTPEEIDMIRALLKKTGDLMLGGGISQGDNREITAPHTPNVAAKNTNSLPDM